MNAIFFFFIYSPYSERLQPPQRTSLAAHRSAFVVGHPGEESGELAVVRRHQIKRLKLAPFAFYLRFSSPSSGVAIARHSSMWPWNSLRTWPPVRKPEDLRIHHITVRFKSENQFLYVHILDCVKKKKKQQKNYTSVRQEAPHRFQMTPGGAPATGSRQRGGEQSV